MISIPALAPFLQIIFGVNSAIKPESLPSFIRPLMDWFYQGIEAKGKQSMLVYLCIFMASIFFFKNLFRYLSLYFLGPVRNGIIRDIRSKTFSKLMDLPMSFYSEERKGDLISRVTSDAQEIEWSMVNVLEAFFRAPLIVIGCLIYMISISPVLTLFVFVLMLFTVLIIGGVSRKLREGSHLAQTQLGYLISIIEETLGGIKIIKAFSNEDYIKRKFEKENNEYRMMITKVLRRRDLSSPLSEFMGVSIVCVLLWFGSGLVFAGKMDGGLFLSIIFAFYSIIDPAKSFSEAYFNTQKGMAAYQRIEEVWETPIVVEEPAEPMVLDQFKHSILFDDVSFRYNSNEKYAIRNLSLELSIGKMVALVGMSGAGKTTIADLLLRLMDPTEGAILVDGVDIRKYKLSDWRGMIAFVSQEPVLFNDSIRNNIGFSSNIFEDKALLDIATAANAKEFIEKSEIGLDTNIGDRGMKLSGGQRQRLTIARALLKNAPILILDEATSALDSESEKQVQDALDRLMEGRTTLIIAHRLSTIMHADLICVLKEGEIVEKGTHQELIKNEGEYARFVALQGLN